MRIRTWNCKDQSSQQRGGTIEIASLIGTAAGACTVVSYTPQVIKAWKTKKVDDLSLRMFTLLVTAAVLWITYGVLASSIPVIATNVGTLALNSAILTAKIKYGQKSPASKK